jgi:hypothetical protein
MNMKTAVLVFATAMRLFAASTSSGPEYIDVHLKEPLDPFTLKLYGVAHGGGSFVKGCARDSSFWVFHKDLFTTCAQANARLQSNHLNISDAAFRKQGGGCSDLQALPEAISNTFGSNHYLLTKQFSPCSKNDSSALARKFGQSFVTREIEENIESCLIFDSLTFLDTADHKFKERSIALGRAAHQTLPTGTSVMPKDSTFTSSPFVKMFAVAGCIDRKSVDRIVKPLDSKFRVVRVLAK